MPTYLVFFGWLVFCSYLVVYVCLLFKPSLLASYIVYYAYWVGGWVDGWIGILIVNLLMNTMAQAKLNSKVHAGIAPYILMKFVSDL